MRHTMRHIFGAILCLTLVGALLVACSAPAPAPTPTKAPAAPAATKAPAAEPTKAPAAAPTKAAEPTKAAADASTKPASAPGKLGPMPQFAPINLQWAAGAVGGGWYALSAGMADMMKQEVPALQINVVPGSGVANHPRTAKNDVQFAMGFPSLAKALLDGVDPYS